MPILVSGCAETDLLAPVAPGKYDFLDCPSITKRLARVLYEEANLARLMSRASEGVGGAMVNAMAYQDQYNTAACRRARIAQSGRSQKMFAVGNEPATGRATGLRWPQSLSTPPARR